MRPRVIIEVLIVLAVVGLILEVAEGYSWVLIGAGIATAIWLTARSH